MMIHIRRSRIIGTETVVYSAWMAGLSASTITSVDGQRYGRMGTETLTPDLEALKPRSTDRYQQVRRFQAQNYARAYRAIVDEYPHLLNQRTYCSLGEIDTREEDPSEAI